MEESILLQSQGFQVKELMDIYHRELGVVAAKVMKNELFDVNEWDVAGILNSDPHNMCPFIVRNILAKKFDKMTVILMEFANLGNLKNIIDTNVYIPIPLVRVIMKQLLQGLSYIHSKGIVHRDIKGANILIHNPLNSGRIIMKITDFGVVKILTEAQRSALMSVAGTSAFMSPELLLGNDNELKTADAKVDVWSFGILIYQIVTHTFPFNPHKIVSIVQFVTNKVLIRPYSITDDNLWNLLVQMLAFDRKDRISAEDALKHPFFTSQQALSEITQEQRQLAQTAQIEQQNGNQQISEFDTNPSYNFPLADVQMILGPVDPDNEIF
ncbi:MAG: putative Serine/threonine-protein kinase STK11 [Streblomastix strix]|uniref:Putative Serine/threonine-protein kinase STK11 n=1 Tax=Streblomastix strix TaxID=222440 RepID=A0A5J4WIF7_9EUKA|nr:MAG: putative Serine/threonine-protein kinase STK11 [Streblomastix strix]